MGHKVKMDPPQSNGDQRAQGGCPTHQPTQMMVFGNPLLASAGLDRLSHRADVVVIIGTSFRAHGPRCLEKEVPIESVDSSS
jgi:hypothetical protein